MRHITSSVYCCMRASRSFPAMGGKVNGWPRHSFNVQAAEMFETVFYDGILAARDGNRQNRYTGFPGQVNPARFGLDQIAGFRARPLRGHGQDLALLAAGAGSRGWPRISAL